MNGFELNERKIFLQDSYLNTDLEIFSKENLFRLSKVLNKKCLVLHCKKEDNGLWHVVVEAIPSRIRSPQKDIERLLKVINGLKEEMKSLIGRAAKFDFNIGCKSIEKYPSVAFCIPNKILELTSSVGATLSVTIYPPDKNE